METVDSYNIAVSVAKIVFTVESPLSYTSQTEVSSVSQTPIQFTTHYKITFWSPCQLLPDDRVSGCLNLSPERYKT